MQVVRRLFIGGNWKSTMSRSNAHELVTNTLNKIAHNPDNVEVVVFPNNLLIGDLSSGLTNPNIHVSFPFSLT